MISHADVFKDKELKLILEMNHLRNEFSNIDNLKRCLSFSKYLIEDKYLNALDALKIAFKEVIFYSFVYVLLKRINRCIWMIWWWKKHQCHYQRMKMVY